jgi:hypothetical protein
MGTGAILIILGLILWLAAGWTIVGLILIAVGLLLGGFRRGSWY